ncbi:hypothetical protein [Acinetobacter equi]|uniref:Uncharacterized protein n=1 Tax=Acinetobacter equi TaxID=1324350 RepID=A0A0N9VWE8_9GAMM|nr:hypothetical protein [Acinetobacter equi]ALH94385.1 hypothetical protein AOY20_01845 [Acinetobacter equi]
MLEFWFDSQISPLKKLMLLIAILAVTVLLYFKQPLELDAILMFLATGLIFLICRYCKLNYAIKKPTGLFYRILTWIPIALLLALIFMQMKNGDILLAGAQGIGFMALATCLFSPLSLFNKNKPQ